VSPERAYAAALTGDPCRLLVDGREVAWQAKRWLGEPDRVDHAMLDECSGATVDLGCGPGRMTVELLRRGNPALGVDVVDEAVRIARQRGAAAVVANVFDRLPAEGRWHTVLLADGNIGMGGDPARLVRRAAGLLGPTGRLVVEVARPGSKATRHSVRLEVGGRLSAPFAWASVPAEQLAALAESVAIRMLRLRSEGGRWLATLEKEQSCG
jgi:SAM-dependent methyltransferase